MARRKRDFKAEGRRRKALGKERGLSPSQTWGHAKKGERSVSEMKRKGYFPRTRREEAARRAIRRMTRGESMSRAARAEGISPSTVKRYGLEHGLIEHVPYEEARRFRPSYRPSTTPAASFIQAGGVPISNVRVDKRNASILGRYLNAVQKWRLQGDPSALPEFRGVVVRDIHGRRYVLASDPNEIDLAFSLMGDEEAQAFEANAMDSPGVSLMGLV